MSPWKPKSHISLSSSQYHVEHHYREVSSQEFIINLILFHMFYIKILKRYLFYNKKTLNMK